MPRPSKSKHVRQSSQSKARKRTAKGISRNGRERLAGQFFASRTLKELADAQGVGPMRNPKQMAGAWPAEEDVDQFLLETYQTRG
jgi:hypothetical protein